MSGITVANEMIPVVKEADGSLALDVSGVHYRAVNRQLRQLVDEGAERIVLRGVAGQRYLATNLHARMRLEIEGVPGNDLGAFMDGPDVIVRGHAQDGCGNTMNSGSLVIQGSAGDIVGHSMRGGAIYVRDDVGYRVGIHMKEYGNTRPVIVIGGVAQHFLGEYMAGGVAIVLGRQLPADAMQLSRYVGTGMHGGVIYLRGRVQEAFLGKEVGMVSLGFEDQALLERYVGQYGSHFGLEVDGLLSDEYTKLVPKTKRPYGQLYAY